MRTSLLLAGLCLSLSSLSLAQPQLAPNPACPNNAPFCSTPIAPAGNSTLGVIGVNAGLVYGTVTVSAGSACPLTTTVTSSPSTLCFYSTRGLTPENWVYLGQFSAPDNVWAWEVVFAPGPCSPYRYIYTSGAHILRASWSDDWNSYVDVAYANTQLGFTGLPNLPQDTGAKASSFAAADLGWTTRLFYGNYNDHSSNPPHAYLWHSDDCGGSWTQYEFAIPKPGIRPVPDCTHPLQSSPPYSSCYHGREIHAVAVDPADGSIYVNVDIEDADVQVGGLWRSVDGGSSFSHVASNYIGIGFAFPTGTNNLFMEMDYPGDAPLLSWDKVNGGNIQEVGFPIPQPPEPQWTTSLATGIKVTCEQNIIVRTNPGNTQIRAGNWFLGPPYTTATLLEDLQPPIQSITSAAGTVTVQTFHPHGIQNGDYISIENVNPTQFNSPLFGNGYPMPVPNLNVTGEKTFTYSCPNCQASGSGGYVKKFPFGWGLTFEATDPIAPNTTYLYFPTNLQKYVKPQFDNAHRAASQTPLLVTKDSSGAWFLYLGQEQHVQQVGWIASNNTFGRIDFGCMVGAPNAAPGSALFVNKDSAGAWVGYIDANQQVQQIWWDEADNIWGVNPLSSLTSAPPAALGTPLLVYKSSSDAWFLYVDASQHVQQIWWIASTNTFGRNDLTSMTSAPLASTGSPLFVNRDSAGGWVGYTDVNGHVQLIWWIASTNTYGRNDLSQITYAPPAAPNTPLLVYKSPWDAWFLYIDANRHVQQIWWIASNNTFGRSDLTSMMYAPLAAFGSPLTVNRDSAGGWVGYVDINGHVQQFWWIASTNTWGMNDLSSITYAPPAVANTPLLVDKDTSGASFVYIDANQHVEQIWWIASNNTFGRNDLTSMLAAPLAAVGSPLSLNIDSAGAWIGYTDTDGHVQQLWWIRSTNTWGRNDLNSSIP